MRDRLDDAEDQITELSIANGSLIAEVNMLRGQLQLADADRIRLQATASTLSGELMAIQDVINGSVRRALSAGIEAAQTKEQHIAEVQADAENAVEAALAQEPEPEKASPVTPLPRQHTNGNGSGLPDAPAWGAAARH
jgi:hypothetical protein